jgi:hypothetical protein
MRLVSTVVAFLDIFYAYAQPTNQADILACITAEPGSTANETLVKYGLPPPNDPNLLVGFYCEPLGGIVPCNKPYPPG